MNNTNAQFAQGSTAPKSEMESAMDSLFVELGSLSAYISNLENKLIPVLMPIGVENAKGSSPVTAISPEAPYLTQLRNARSQVMLMSDRLEKLRDNLVV